MSHFAVVAFTRNGQWVEDLMARYDEENQNFYKFVPSELTDEQLHEKYNKFLEQNPGYAESGFEYYLKEICGYIYKDGILGKEYNPEGYFDYYSDNARQLYAFNLKERFKGDDDNRVKYYSFINNYNYEDVYRTNIFKDLYYKLKYWKRANEQWKYETNEGKKITAPKYYDYIMTRYGTRKQYVKEYISSHPVAFITPDGVWHSPGIVGWFASDNFTKDSMNKYIEEWKAFIKDKRNKNLIMHQIDCHI